MRYKISFSLILIMVFVGCESGSPKKTQRPKLNTNGTSTQISNTYQGAQSYMPQIKDQLQTDFLNAIKSQDGRYLFVLKQNNSHQEELQFWDNRTKKYLYTLARINAGKHIEAIRAMSKNRVMFLEVEDGRDTRSGRVVIIDYKQKKVLGSYTLPNLSQNYYTNINVDNKNQNIVNIGDVSIDFTNESSPNSYEKPTQLNVVNSNGKSMDNNVRNYFGDDLVMAVPTLQKQGLFVVKRKPHFSQDLDLYGMIGGIEYEYTLWQLYDHERFEKIVPMSDGKIIFIIRSDIAPAGYAKIITYDYVNKYKMNEIIKHDLYDIQGYTITDWENDNNQYQVNTSSSGVNSDYSTGSDWANSNSYTNYEPVYTTPSNDVDSDYSTGSQWANSDTTSDLDTQLEALLAQIDATGGDNETSSSGSGLDSDYSTGSVSANTDWAVLKKGKWYGTGHQTWKVVEDYRIELTIDDNEYYFTYTGKDYRCYGSLVLEETTADSFKFREYVNDGHCIENYFVLKKITDEHYSYESYLLDGTHTVSGNVYYNSDHTNSRY